MIRRLAERLCDSVFSLKWPSEGHWCVSLHLVFFLSTALHEFEILRPLELENFSKANSFSALACVATRISSHAEGFRHKVHVWHKNPEVLQVVDRSKMSSKKKN